jgi:heat shock protein HslJ
MPERKIYLIIIMLIIGIQGCASKESAQIQEKTQAQTAAMPSGSWQTIAMRGKAIKGHNPNFTLDMTKNAIYGFSGCNRFFGSFSLNGKNIKFSQLASTMMLCESANVEKDFFADIGRTDHYRLEGDVLTFYDEDSNKLLENIKTAD